MPKWLNHLLSKSCDNECVCKCVQYSKRTVRFQTLYLLRRISDRSVTSAASLFTLPEKFQQVTSFNVFLKAPGGGTIPVVVPVTLQNITKIFRWPGNR